MNDRPTCKVVKGIAPYPNLARIHPKGCKIRNVLEQGVEQDVIRTYNKTGDRKIRKKTVGRKIALLIARPFVADNWQRRSRPAKIVLFMRENEVITFLG